MVKPLVLPEVSTLATGKRARTELLDARHKLTESDTVERANDPVDMIRHNGRRVDAAPAIVPMEHRTKNRRAIVG